MKFIKFLSVSLTSAAAGCSLKPDATGSQESSAYSDCSFIVKTGDYYNVGVEMHTDYDVLDGEVLIPEQELQGFSEKVEEVPETDQYYCDAETYKKYLKE